MIDDPITLTTTLASVLTSNGGFATQEFRLKDLKTGGSVRICDSAQGRSWTLSLLQQQSNENKASGLITDRTNVRLDIAYAGPVDGEGGAGAFVQAKSSVSIVFSLPRGIPNALGAGEMQAALVMLVQLLLTASVDPAANTALSLSGSRLQRILAGEP
jgi:hypothetical protein